RHTRVSRDWSSDVCSSDLAKAVRPFGGIVDPFQADGGQIYRFHRHSLLRYISKSGTLAHGIATNSFFPFSRMNYTLSWKLNGTRSEERRVGKECGCMR